MTTTNQQQPTTPPRAAEDEMTATLEPHIVAMQRTIDEAVSRRNIALSAAAIMKAVG